MSKTDIAVYMDYVLVLGVRIDRPAHICRSAWTEFWNGL